MEIITRHKPKFTIDIESMLSLPASVFWKDVNGKFLGCNDVMADLVCLLSRHVVFGMDDADLVGKEVALPFMANDRKVINSCKPMAVNEYFRTEKGILIKGFSTKAPLFDGEGDLVGLYGISFLEEVNEDYHAGSSKLPLHVQNQYNNILSQTHRSIVRHHSSGSKTVENLSDREAQSLRMLANGMTAKAIGKELDLSKRTVESYIESAKSKLGCMNKIELIVAAIKQQYIDIDNF